MTNQGLHFQIEQQRVWLFQLKKDQNLIGMWMIYTTLMSRNLDNFYCSLCIGSGWFLPTLMYKLVLSYLTAIDFCLSELLRCLLLPVMWVYKIQPNAYEFILSSVVSSENNKDFSLVSFPLKELGTKELHSKPIGCTIRTSVLSSLYDQ